MSSLCVYYFRFLLVALRYSLGFLSEFTFRNYIVVVVVVVVEGKPLPCPSPVATRGGVRGGASAGGSVGCPGGEGRKGDPRASNLQIFHYIF